jgi:hypothetical protein
MITDAKLVCLIHKGDRIEVDICDDESGRVNLVLRVKPLDGIAVSFPDREAVADFVARCQNGLQAYDDELEEVRGMAEG